MDFGKLVARARAILTAPRTEWPLIGTEPATVAGLYRQYIVWLAAIPAIAGFIKGSLIGYSLLGITVRVPIGAGIAGMLVQYLLGLVMVYVVAWVIDALAPSFAGQKDRVQAVKAIAYAYTASWVASIAIVLPWIGGLIALAGGIYGIYLLYLGLPHTMRCPQDRSLGYTAITVVLVVILGWIIGIAVAAIAGTGAFALGGLDSSSSSKTATSPFAALGNRLAEAGKQMEAAQQSGDSKAQSQALGKMLGAVVGGGAQVQALSPEQLKPFVPATLAGLPRTSFKVERNTALGMQIAEARASYSDGARTLDLQISDLGSAKGMLALAGWAAIGNEQVSDHGYEKTYKQDGRLVHEKWNDQTKRGEYSLVLGDRFTVKVSGQAASIDALKAAVASIDLAGLEALKGAGVKSS